MKFTARKRILAVILAVVALVGVLAAPLAAQAKTGWVKEDGQWYCYDENGNIIRNGWAEYQGKYYWMGPTCTAYASMWVIDNGSWYHLGSSGARDVNKWVKGVKAEGTLFGLDCDGGYFYVGSDGRMVVDGWAKTGKGYYCFGSDGRPITDRWILYEGKWYHLGSSGKLDLNELIAGVHTEGLPWNYDDTDGWFHVNARGWLDTNTWVRYGKYYLYAGSDGKTVSNQWVPYEGDWYHFNNSYVLDTNKMIDGYPEEGSLFGFNCQYGDIFFVDSYGRLRTNEIVEWSGDLYFVGSDGKAAKDQWVGYYYAGSDGRFVKNGIVNANDGSWYCIRGFRPVVDGWGDGKNGSINYYGSDGRAVRNGVVPFRGDYYFVDEWGNPVVNQERWWEDDLYYFDANGKRVANYLNSWTYHYFGADGKRVLQSDWIPYQGKLIYIRNGEALHDGWYQIGNWSCEFDSSGYFTNNAKPIV